MVGEKLDMPNRIAMMYKEKIDNEYEKEEKTLQMLQDSFAMHYKEDPEYNFS